MRITNSMVYTSVIRNTNAALARYYALNEQNASEKRINRPSDDPAGTATVLSLRNHLAVLEQYQKNIDMASAALAAADDALGTVSELITSAKELAEQGATGTLSASQREILAEEVRQLMEQMLTQANTEYLGDSIFAGQRTDGSAYVLTLAADVAGPTLAGADVLAVSGDATHTVQVEFLDSGTVGGAADLGYRWSADGGTTWTTATLAAGDTTLTLGSCSVTLASGAAVSGEADAAGQSTLTVRPAALYQGDAKDGAVVRHAGSSPVNATASGVFASKVVVRIDADADLGSAIAYSYSTDGGASWVTGNSATGGVLTVPGGTLTLTAGGGTDLYAGDQFTLVPEEADIAVAVSDGTSVVVNNVGKDIFGGLYQAVGSTQASAVSGGNLFETMGRLVAALETNDMDAVAQCLVDLDTAQETVLRGAASVGARESRLASIEAALVLRKESDTQLMSAIEDADLVTLMTKLQAAQTAYTSVVETSAEIMTLSMVDLL
ncbi:flagellar hook-associated protein FlgL [Desulfocurvus vexinensis]|uniref:flagellar hook-associated protein FlgL n=1 Tax=Desulfocurvus vexinensis TaxID=399548 RepID=UPI0004918870|nr:flagellar hook-associated protein FlgL [Desulfocurvus vexinensis]